MDLINNVIEKVQYIGYQYNSKEEKSSHILEMEKNKYEYLYHLSDDLHATYRKILDMKPY